MTRFLTLALVCGLTTVGFARPPMLAPLNEQSINYQAQYSPQPIPTPNTAIPPAPGMIPQDQASTQPGLPPGSYIVPGQPMTTPFPHLQSPIGPQPGMILGDACDMPYVPLYTNVRVIQERNIAPCAVRKIVSVPDPCNPCQCVYICICVPPCACEDVSCSPHKDRVTFDYGKYAVKVTQRRGHLVVNYDD